MTDRIDIEKLREEASGRWPSILAGMGVDKRHLTNRHGPCPICDAGTDRYRFDDKDGRGTWYCSQCGSGDGFGLIAKLKNWSFIETAREVQKALGTTPQPKTKVRLGRPIEAVQAEIREIWKTSQKLTDNPATSLWWMSRIGRVPDSAVLKACPLLKCSGQMPLPAMVALVHGLDGKVVNMHRTYLANSGVKADIPSPRRLMDMEHPPGSAVRLAKPGDVLGIAEGIETAAAATVLFGIPCWAALNKQKLEEWRPPSGVEKVIVFGDSDANLVGQRAAYVLGERLMREKINTDVRIPSSVGQDWNDVLLAQLDQSAAA